METNTNNLPLNQNSPTNSIPEPPVVAQQPPVQPPIEISPEGKKKNKFIKIFSDFWMNLNPALKKVLMVTGFIFGLLVFVAIIFSISSNTGKKVKSTPTPSGIDQQSPLPEIILNPSRYATDSAILVIEDILKTIEKEIGETQINDLKLSPPNLLWDINFED